MTGTFTGPTEVADEAAIDAVCRLRASVWREAGGTAPDAFPADRWSDRLDAVARHWVMTRQGEPVAAARLTVHDRLEEVPEADAYLEVGITLDGRIAAPARVVVAPSARGHGLASRLLDAQDAAAVEAGAAYGVAQVSPAMYPIRERRGWIFVAHARPDPRFPGVPFRIMTLSY